MVDIFDCEKVVEEMQRKADAVLSDVMSEFDISHVVAGFSGGDDSVVSTHWAMEKFGDAVVMIGDTKIGLYATRKHQDSVARQFGWNVCRVSPDPELTVKPATRNGA